jgi:hypothetical protein
MARIASDFRHGSKNSSANGTGGAVMCGAVMLPRAAVVRDRIQPSTTARSPWM